MAYLYSPWKTKRIPIDTFKVWMYRNRVVVFLLLNNFTQPSTNFNFIDESERCSFMGFTLIHVQIVNLPVKDPSGRM